MYVCVFCFLFNPLFARSVCVCLHECVSECECVCRYREEDNE